MHDGEGEIHMTWHNIRDFIVLMLFIFTMLVLMIIADAAFAATGTITASVSEIATVHSDGTIAAPSTPAEIVATVDGIEVRF